MTASILPPNATALERAFEAVLCERIGSFPVAISQLKDPVTAPAEVLPWLAWEASVDTWDSEWTDAQKRAAIAASIEVHRCKGTVGAVRRAVAAQDAEVTVKEWRETGKTPFTFSVEATTKGGITARKQADIMAAILATKNARSHLSGVTFTYNHKTDVPRMASVVRTGATITVIPRSADVAVSGAKTGRATMCHAVSIITIQPVFEAPQ